MHSSNLTCSPSGLVFFFFFCFFYRRMTLQRLQRRPKTSPRTTRRGSEWWSSPRARMTLLQLLVGHFGFPFFLSAYLHISTQVPLKANPTLAPFGHFYPSLKPHISKLQNTALNRWHCRSLTEESRMLSVISLKLTCNIDTRC